MDQCHSTEAAFKFTFKKSYFYSVQIMRDGMKLNEADG
jgi:hypothetical protein